LLVEAYSSWIKVLLKLSILIVYFKVIYMSLDLYISESSLVIGTFPMVFLKNTSSIVDGLMERKAGKSNRSFPKRQGCVGYLRGRETKTC